MQIKAKEVVSILSQKLDYLFKSYGFLEKKFESDKETFTEKLIYRRGNFEFRITVCLHPHDYPQLLNVQVKEDSRFYNLSELLKGKQNLQKELLIATDDQIKKTYENLEEIAKSILSELQ